MSVWDEAEGTVRNTGFGISEGRIYRRKLGDKAGNARNKRFMYKIIK